jgi:hypothetical protein
MMRKLVAVLVPSALVILSPACVADAGDGPEEEAVGDAAEPGVSYGRPPSSAENALRTWLITHTGRCAPACLAAMARFCPWKEVCDDTDFVDCAGTTLTCAEAEDAGRGWGAGVNDCYASCAGAHF